MQDLSYDQIDLLFIKVDHDQDSFWSFDEFKNIFIPRTIEYKNNSTAFNVLYQSN